MNKVRQGFEWLDNDTHLLLKLFILFLTTGFAPIALFIGFLMHGIETHNWFMVVVVVVCGLFFGWVFFSLCSDFFILCSGSGLPPNYDLGGPMMRY